MRYLTSKGSTMDQRQYLIDIVETYFKIRPDSIPLAPEIGFDTIIGELEYVETLDTIQLRASNLVGYINDNHDFSVGLVSVTPRSNENSQIIEFTLDYRGEQLNFTITN